LIIRPRLRETAHDGITLKRLSCPMTFRVKGKIIDDNVDDLLRKALKSSTIVCVIEGLRLSCEGSRGLNEDEIIDQRIKLRQPNVQNVQLVEKCETVENTRHIRDTEPRSLEVGTELLLIAAWRDYELLKSVSVFITRIE
jgi:hypothetical protein